MSKGLQDCKQSHPRGEGEWRVYDVGEALIASHGFNPQMLSIMLNIVYL